VSPLPTGAAWPGGPEWVPGADSACLHLPDGAQLHINRDGGDWVVEFGRTPSEARGCHYAGPKLDEAQATVTSLVEAWHEWHARED